MTAKRFILHEHDKYGDAIEDTDKEIQNWIDSLYQCCELLNELDDENKKILSVLNDFNTRDLVPIERIFLNNIMREIGINFQSN